MGKPMRDKDTLHSFLDVTLVHFYEGVVDMARDSGVAAPAPPAAAAAPCQRFDSTHVNAAVRSMRDVPLFAKDILLCSYGLGALAPNANMAAVKTALKRAVNAVDKYDAMQSHPDKKDKTRVAGTLDQVRTAAIGLLVCKWSLPASHVLVPRAPAPACSVSSCGLPAACAAHATQMLKTGSSLGGTRTSSS